MRVLDLFSGIGGFSLGLEWAGMETVAFCEIDPFCQKVLRKHWPDVPIYDDIHEVSDERLKADGIKSVDVVCGGFPCQPFSTASAGKRRGDKDDRFLWPEMLRVIEEVKPRFVIAENVAGIERMALGRVVSDLEASGLRVLPPLIIPACAVGKLHRRNRYWFLAYSDCDGKSRRAVNDEASELSKRQSDRAEVGMEDGIPSRVDERRRLKALGNAVVPQVVQVIGEAIMKEHYGD